jgi:pseudoazurin
MKNLITLVVSVFAVVFVSSMAYSADMSIDMLNKLGKEKMVYSVDVAEIDAGDTITWLPATKGHNVHFIAGPDGWDLPKKSKNNKEVAITFDTPGIYLYQCTPHASMGMIALVIVDGDTSNLDAIAKAKVRGKSKKKLKKLLGEL